MRTGLRITCTMLLLSTTACHPRPSQPAGQPVPIPLAMRERDENQFDRIWSFRGKSGYARGDDGMAANLSIERFDTQKIIIHRTDFPGSRFAGFTALYIGTLHGNQIDGRAVWNWPNHPPVSGPWSAMIPPSAAEQQTLLNAPVSSAPPPMQAPVQSAIPPQPAPLMAPPVDQGNQQQPTGMMGGVMRAMSQVPDDGKWASGGNTEVPTVDTEPAPQPHMGPSDWIQQMSPENNVR